tara:strand:+ start:2140 stop:2259 length:120 start_codon:yes stop_codon:yes gene_type:complete
MKESILYYSICCAISFLVMALYIRFKFRNRFKEKDEKKD